MTTVLGRRTVQRMEYCNWILIPNYTQGEDKGQRQVSGPNIAAVNVIGQVHTGAPPGPAVK